MLKRISGLVLALVILGKAGSVAAQEEELQNLVEESQQQQDDLEQIPGGDLPGLGQDLVSGKVRLPSGEEVEKQEDIARIENEFRETGKPWSVFAEYNQLFHLVCYNLCEIQTRISIVSKQSSRRLRN